MTKLLDQLYQTKLQLIAVLTVVTGVSLLLLAHWAGTPNAPGWVAALPLGEIGSTLFGTGLLAIFFEYVDRKHGDKRTDQRIRAAVRHEAPAIRDAVFDSLASNPDALQAIASNDTLDRIASNALGLRLGDQALAHDVYTDLRDQVIRAPERWHDVDVSVSLAEPQGSGTVGRGPLFEATVRWEYRTVPGAEVMRFACVSDPAEQRELFRDQATSSVWYVGRNGGLDAASRDVFELLQLSVDGQPRKVRRTERRGAQTYSVALQAPAEQEVVIAYTFRALVQQHGHLLYLDLPRPAKGLHVSLDYRDVGIRRVNTLDYFAGTIAPRFDEAPDATAAQRIDLSFDGWIFPRSGMAFVWVLEGEQPTR